MHTRFSCTAKRVGHGLLNLGFGLLCLQHLITTGQESDWTAAMLSVVGFSLGWWRPAAGLFALILLVPLISGLQLTVLSIPYSAILVIASSFWLGLVGRKLLPRAEALGSRTESVAAPDPSGNWIDQIVNTLATIALISMYVQICRHGDAPAILQRICPSSMPHDTSYFLPGFLWLHGLFYFRAIREHSLSGITAPAGVKLVLLVQMTLLLLFFGVQWLSGIPFRWIPGFQSPYEDIATFGIMAACLMVACLALIRRGPNDRSWILGSMAVFLAIAVGASWSRGTWLAATVFICALAFLRLPRSAGALVIAALLSTIVILDVRMPPIAANEHTFLSRLMALVRPENLSIMSTGRFAIYGQAVAMIRDRPWTGHGIGSFFGDVPRYPRPDDPFYNAPHFAHNIWLQMAAEQGVLVATLFIGLVGWALWRGIRCWNTFRRLQTKGVFIPEQTRAELHLVLALTLMLGAYLQANMTWEILLVHPTQPFFFWFLLAALWTMTERVNASISSLGKSKPAEPKQEQFSS
ncbi:MAG TPA: O-antigen ligase family protein [Lacunisphaera sp.]|jgi:O-antigen ligase|nr:O-antigen ligase family protein [Lacunisphaera sp.]